MNILIAGYGNIGRAVTALLEQHPVDEIDSVLIAEKKNGTPAEDLIRRKKDEIDLVIDTTDHSGGPVMSLCKLFGIHYLEAGLYRVRDILDRYRDVPENHVSLSGFGMNPGLIEYMYRIQRIDKRHAVLEIEKDTAESPEPVFCTWSPRMYLLESAEERPTVCIDGKLRDGLRSAEEKCVRLNSVEPLNGTFLWTPHEELYSFFKANPHCVFSGFLYSAPSAVQSLALRYRNSETFEVDSIPVPCELKGRDVVGVLVLDDSGEARYVYNSADHERCYKRYGINGTSWQVACGIYTGIRLLPHLNPGVFTFSTLPEHLFDRVTECLDELDFRIETQTIPSAAVFKRITFPLENGERVSCFPPE